ncbi:hypothetical protein ABZX74_41645 [Streptomyces olivaceoviridis]|uniref:hypothetical protein n=1 Tax=Streptomyces olivaceoviridis TaxID=1921 RepID=UPI0033B5F735
MTPRTPRSAVEPIATSGSASADRRIRRAAALPMPDGASMSPLAPADPLGAGQDESTLRSLASALAASRTAQDEPETDPAAWRPRGTEEAGQEAAATDADGAATAPAGSPPRRTGGGRLTSKVAERPFLVAAALAGAVVAATPFMTSNGKGHTTTYEGLGQADPVAVGSGGAPDRHPDAYPSQVPLQDPGAGGGTTSADNLLDPDAGAWHGSTDTSATGGSPAAQSPVVPDVLAADTSGAHTPAPSTGTTVAAARPAQDADAPGPAVVAASPKSAAAHGSGASKPAATESKAARTAAADAPDKAATTTAAARTASPTSTSAATTTKPADTKPADTKATDTKATDTKAADTKAADTKAADTKAADTKAADTKAADTKPTNTTPTDTTNTKPANTKAADNTPASDRQQATSSQAAGTSADTPSDQAADPAPAPAQAAPAPQWSTKVFTSTLTLRPGESVHSDRMRITMRAGGDLVISDENGTVRWSSGTTGQNNYATFKADGELVVRSAYQHTLWSSRTGGHTGAKLVIQNDGNVTILSSGDQTLWAAGTQH